MISVVAGLSVHFYLANKSQSKRGGVLENMVSLEHTLLMVLLANIDIGGLPVHLLALDNIGHGYV